MRKGLLATAFLVAALVASPAQAQFNLNIGVGPGGVKTLSGSTESALKEIDKVKGETKLDKALFAADETIASARKKWDTTQNQYNRVVESFNRIPQGEAWHPKVKDAKKFVDAFQAKMESWKEDWAGLEKKFEGERKLRSQFDEFVREFHDALGLLARVEKDAKKAVTNVDNAVKYWNDIDALSKVVEECKGRFAGLKNLGEDDANGPESVCARAARAKDLLKPYMKATAEEHVKMLVERTKKATAEYAKDGWIAGDLITEIGNVDQLVQEQKRRVEPLYKAAGEEQPATLFDALVAAAKDFFAEVDVGTKKYVLPKAASNDPTVSKVINAALSKYDPRGRTVQVLAVRVSDTTWNIIKNEFSLPLRREKNADILLKVPGEKYCRQVAGWVAQDYSGAGTYQAPGNGGWGDNVRLLDCGKK